MGILVLKELRDLEGMQVPQGFLDPVAPRERMELQEILVTPAMMETKAIKATQEMLESRESVETWGMLDPQASLGLPERRVLLESLESLAWMERLERRGCLVKMGLVGLLDQMDLMAMMERLDNLVFQGNKAFLEVMVDQAAGDPMEHLDILVKRESKVPQETRVIQDPQAHLAPLDWRERGEMLVNLVMMGHLATQGPPGILVREAILEERDHKDLRVQLEARDQLVFKALVATRDK